MSIVTASLFTACSDDKGMSLRPDESGVGETDASLTGEADEAVTSADAAVPQVEADASCDAALVDAGVAEESTQSDGGAERDAGCGLLTYENFGQRFMEDYCLSCHGALEPMLTTRELVLDHRVQIRAEAVDSKRMPEGGNADLTDRERAQLGLWLACGAP